MIQVTNEKKKMARYESKINKARKALREAIREWNRNYSYYIDTAPKLDNFHLKKCQLLPDRYELIRYMPKNSIVCEVGTNKGEFAQKILEITSPKELHIIDISFEKFEWQDFQKKDINKVSKTYEVDSAKGLSDFPPKYFDWIYIDADHYYEGVMRDIAVAKEKVKDKGHLIFNDYTTWSSAGVSRCGVAKAVNQFCKEENWEFVYFALHNNMYCDVAIKKM